MAIELPKREYLTFPELAQRWKCNENDIRRLVISQQLIPSFVINHVAKLVRLIESEEDGRKIWVPQQVKNDEYHLHDGDADQWRFKYKLLYTHGFYYLLHPYQDAPLSCQFMFYSKDRDHQVDTGDTCLMRTGKGEQGEPLSLDQVLCEGAVMITEVERYESYLAKLQMEKSSPLEQQYVPVATVATKRFKANETHRAKVFKVVQELGRTDGTRPHDLKAARILKARARVVLVKGGFTENNFEAGWKQLTKADEST